jgi:hypothetical protein
MAEKALPVPSGETILPFLWAMTGRFVRRGRDSHTTDAAPPPVCAGAYETAMSNVPDQCLTIHMYTTARAAIAPNMIHSGLRPAGASSREI